MNYVDYMNNQPMRDGMEIRSFFDEINEETKAKAFWKDLMGTLWHDPECKSTHGTMSAALVADRMGITEEKASEFLWACVHYRITDRQNGGFVV